MRPALEQEWKCPDAEAAAARFESEASPQNWPLEEIAEHLRGEGKAVHVDAETGREVEARRL
jgi:hypothetical protein